MRRPFALLDDASSGSIVLLDDLVSVAVVTPLTIDDALAEGWRHGWRALAWLPYEWGDADGALYWFASSTPVDDVPDSEAGFLDPLRPDISEAEHSKQIAVIKEAIAAGSSYQANYTFRLKGKLRGDPVGLYRSLRLRQPTAFGLLARLPPPADPWTLSLSPELFLDVQGELVTARPMKGTASADLSPEALSQDPKNRAENLMIVDLLRNDLSRVADKVEVIDLFGVERVADLWQMSTTVRGHLRAGTTFGDLLGATFPCGSITGAPKQASMELISQVEASPRGIYTGALGVLDPDAMRLSIAIRTLTVDDTGQVTFGVGSGVVADSTAESEWSESLAKSAFVTPVSLKETIRVVDHVSPLQSRHEQRLAQSAAALGHRHDRDLIASAIDATPPGAWRVALTIAPDGSAEISRTPLPQQQTAHVSVLLARAPWPVGPHHRLKTSDRAHLDQAWRSAEASGAFDTIGYDASGSVLEGGRCNVFALVDGHWVTPHRGMLPGVQRAALLAAPHILNTNEIVERTVTVAELLRAERIAVTNAVHGVLMATLEEGS